MGNITPNSKIDVQKMYNGQAPYRIDKFLYWILKMIFQVIVFSLIYNNFINMIQEQYGNNIILEIVFVIFWIIISDIFAHIIALMIEILFDKYKSYFRPKKSKKNVSRKAWEYLIYTVIRALSYSIGFIQILTTILSPFVFQFSIVLAWIIVSLFSKITAKTLSIFISII